MAVVRSLGGFWDKEFQEMVSELARVNSEEIANYISIGNIDECNTSEL